MGIILPYPWDLEASFSLPKVALFTEGSIVSGFLALTVVPHNASGQ